MNARRIRRAAKGLREWWASPPRSGMQRLISPWEYRRLRLFGLARLGGGTVGIAVGVACLAYSAYGWGAFFMLIGALNLACGYWYVTIARPAVPRAAAND